MFKPGDIVKIKQGYRDCYWYSEELYTVISIEYNSINEQFLTLDREFCKYHNRISYNGVYLAIKEYRKQKLEKLKQ